jgi:hypothetical protein
MLGLFRPLENDAGPCVLTVEVLCFVFFLRCILRAQFSAESAFLPLVERDVSTVIWIIEFCYLD